MKSGLMTVLVVMMAVSAPVWAADVLINLDAGTGPVHSGPAVVGLAGDIWNGVETGGATGLQDSAGNVTTVSISTTYGAQYSNGGANADAAIKPLVQDYFYANGKKIVTLSGLEPGAACTLYVIAGECGHDQRGGEWSVDTDGDGNANDPRKVVPALYAAAAFPATLVEDENYVVLEATASAAGEVVLVSEPKNADETSQYWNNMMAIQLVIEGPKGQAHTPDPVNEEIDVDPSVVTSVSWQAPAEPNIVSIAYDVYWSVVDANFVGETPASGHAVQGASTTFTPSPAMDYDTTYYWRVDSHIVWDSNSLTGSFNDVIEGPAWQFSTAPSSTAPEITDFDNILTAIELMPDTLQATVTGNSDPIASVTFDLLTDDIDFPDGAVYTLTDITTDKQLPMATFLTDTAGTYKFRLTVQDAAANSVEALAEITVYADACEAAKAGNWQQNYYDRDGDCQVDLDDFAEFAKEWLDDSRMDQSQTYEGDVSYIPVGGDVVWIEAENTELVLDCSDAPITDSTGVRVENKDWASGGQALGYTNADTWVEYSVDLTAGTYDVTVAVSRTQNSNRKVLFGAFNDDSSYGEIELGYVGSSEVATFTETLTIPTDVTSLVVSWFDGGYGLDYISLTPQ